MVEGDSREGLLWLFGRPETRLRSVGKIPVMAAGGMGFSGDGRSSGWEAQR